MSVAPARPFVSVVIAMRNSAPTLPLLLDSLRRQTYPREAYEVIVVDSDSTDDVAGVLRRFPEVLWFKDSGPGWPSARNAGIRQSRGEIFASTDGDCVPDPDWLERGVAAFASTGGTIIGGEVPMLDPVGRDLNSWEILETVMFQMTNIKRLIDERGFAIGANFMTRRAIFDRTAYFDQALKSGGDKVWIHQAVAKGEILRYAPDMIVRHPRRSTFEEFIRKQRRLVGGRMLLLKRSRPTLGQILADLRKVSLLDGQVYRVVFGDPRARGFGPRLRLVAAGFLVSVITTLEKIRLWCGGETTRG